MTNLGAMQLERNLIEGKVFKRGATWQSLEKFFEKTREVLIKDLEKVANPEEVNRIVEQADANAHYEENVRIIDPDYFCSDKNIGFLFSLNAKLCTVQDGELPDIAKEFMALKYLLLYSSENGTAIKEDEVKTNINREDELISAYRYYEDRNKKVILLTPNPNIIERAEKEGIKVNTLEDALYG